jgi:transposase
MIRDALRGLGNEDLIALVRAQADVNAKQSEPKPISLLQEQVEALEAKQGKPPKTPDNSSTPPSQGPKSNRAERRAKRRKGRPGVTRALAENPDRVLEARAEACPHCNHQFPPISVNFGDAVGNLGGEDVFILTLLRHR